MTQLINLCFWSIAVELDVARSLKTEVVTDALVKPCMARMTIVACKLHCPLSTWTTLTFCLGKGARKPHIGYTSDRTFQLVCVRSLVMPRTWIVTLFRSVTPEWLLYPSCRTAAVHILHSVVNTQHFTDSCPKSMHSEMSYVSLCVPSRQTEERAIIPLAKHAEISGRESRKSSE